MSHSQKTKLINSIPLIQNIDYNINSLKEESKSDVKKENYPCEVPLIPYNRSPAEISNKISPYINSSQIFPSPSLNFPFIEGGSPNPHYLSQLNNNALSSDNQSFSPKN